MLARKKRPRNCWCCKAYGTIRVDRTAIHDSWIRRQHRSQFLFSLNYVDHQELVSGALRSALPWASWANPVLQQPLGRACNFELFKSPLEKHLSNVAELPSLARRKCFQLTSQVLADSYANLCFPLAH
jgi:hypothetical protein